MNQFCYLGHDKVVEVLIQNGVNVNATRPGGLTALGIATQNGKSPSQNNRILWCMAWLINLSPIFQVIEK